MEPIWCRICGLDIKLHGANSHLSKKEEYKEDMLPSTQDADPKENPQVAPFTECSIVPPALQITRLPRIDVKRFVLTDQTIGRGVNVTLDRATLLAAADPSMIQCIHSLTKQWKLDTFHGTTSESSYLIPPAIMPLDKFGNNKRQVETHLAPHALLALLTRQFLRALVSRGLDVSNRDKAKALSARRKASRNQVTDATRLLTPTHVLSGMLSRGLRREAKRDPMDAFLLLGLSRLGVAVDDDEGPVGRPQNGPRIKLEGD
jgi:hypothetical protein